MTEHAEFETVETHRQRTEAPPDSQKLPEDILPRSASTVKSYSRIKLILGLVNTAIFLILVALLVLTGLSASAEVFLRRIFSNDYVVLVAFVILLGMGESILGFPLKFYSGFLLEHRYGLSNQTFVAWVWEGLKGMAVGFAIGLPLILAFYWCLKGFGPFWWIPVGTVLFLVSVVLARIAPIVIFPLFYAFKPLGEGGLKNRLIALCRTAGMDIAGVFQFDMSKNTKKANAAFTGIGKSRRIILGDTLVANFTDDEIETVVAHELGHFKLHHIRTMVVIGAVSTYVGLFLASTLYGISLDWAGFRSVDTIAALPLLSLWLGVYSLVTSPLGNMISRAHERAADRFAVRLSNNREAFVNALEKLARVNLADPDPHPVVEFLFHSHPSIRRRIAAVEALGQSL